MPTDTVVVFCTCPDQLSAEQIAKSLVAQGLAACVNLIPHVISVFQWQGKQESEQEVLMLIKTRDERYPDVEKAVKSLHPYELPELITVPVSRGLPEYLNWVDQCTKKRT